MIIDNEFLAKRDYKPSELVNTLHEITDYIKQLGDASSSETLRDVVFYDYDGTVLTSYSAKNFAALTELPPNPTHEGLISQGWNWSLADAKSHVAKYGKLNIGQIYSTDDGKTRIYIRLEGSRLDPYLGVRIIGSATIDWGDGSSEDIEGTPVPSGGGGATSDPGSGGELDLHDDETFGDGGSSTKLYIHHAYAETGSYTIAIAVNGSMILDSAATVLSDLLGKNSATLAESQCYASAIKKIELGDNVSLGTYAFKNCYCLASIILSPSITEISNNAFENCYSLVSITIPTNVTRVGNNAFLSCYGLYSVTIPTSVTAIGTSAFSSCRCLESIAIPESIGTISSSTFSSCYSLPSVTIPTSVTTVSNNAFASCYALSDVTIPNSVTTISSSAFSSCYLLTRVSMPNTVTTISSAAFSSCYALSSITLSEGLSRIGSQLFLNCQSLTNITIPSSVTKIETLAFSGCRGLGAIHFSSEEPPVVDYANAWNSLPTDCTIYVPAGSLSAYTSATNYPSASTYTYVEE